MKVPFTAEQFFAVFGQYNQAISPFPFVAMSLAAVVLVLIAIRWKPAGQTAAFFMAAMSLLGGIAYHWIYFRPVNPAAAIFTAFFVAQATLLGLFGSMPAKSALWKRTHPNVIVGWVLAVYALVIYPLLGVLFGHTYPAAPVFGAPCPTTIFTFGVLLMLPRTPWWVFVIPTLWAVVGFTAALSLAVYQDVGLLASAVVAIWLLVATGHARRAEEASR